jgi:hypothetical protein
LVGIRRQLFYTDKESASEEKDEEQEENSEESETEEAGMSLFDVMC